MAPPVLTMLCGCRHTRMKHSCRTAMDSIPSASTLQRSARSESVDMAAVMSAPRIPPAIWEIMLICAIRRCAPTLRLYASRSMSGVIGACSAYETRWSDTTGTGVVAVWLPPLPAA